MSSFFHASSAEGLLLFSFIFFLFFLSGVGRDLYIYLNLSSLSSLALYQASSHQEIQHKELKSILSSFTNNHSTTLEATLYIHSWRNSYSSQCLLKVYLHPSFPYRSEDISSIFFVYYLDSTQKESAANFSVPADSASSKAEQDYINRLAKEFSSIPDREVPPPGSPAGTSTFGMFLSIYATYYSFQEY